MEEGGRAGFDPWLVLFIGLLGVCLPLFYVHGFYLDMSVTHMRAQAMGLSGIPVTLAVEMSLLFVLRLGLCGYIVWRMLWVRTPATPRRCAIALALLLIGVPLLEMLMSALLVPLSEEALFRWGGVLSRGCFFAFGGAWFLLKSQAVERNYGVTSEAREIFE